jgi:hypothetical protein
VLWQTAAARETALNQWLTDFDKSKLLMWFVENPFGVIDGEVAQPGNVPSASKRGGCRGSLSEKETICIGTAYTGETPLTCSVQLKGPAPIVDSVSPGILKRVLASDGYMVYDPIVPLEVGDEVILSPNKAVYFWLTIDMHGLPPGNHEAVFLLKSIMNRGIFSEIPLTIRVEPLRFSDNLTPRAMTWGYLSDRPVCKSPEKCAQDMSVHGVNVFVIHPSHIPIPGKQDAAFYKKVALLEKDVALLKGEKRLLILFLRWDKYRPSEIDTKNWVTWIRDKMAAMGLRPSEWALYPVDEPRGKKLVQLSRYAHWIKEAAPTVSVYANPIDTVSEPLVPGDLISLDAVIDIWQPSLDLVSKWNGRFFNARRPAWWLYHNPPSPAKTASPLGHYRMMAWKAWFLGAAGIGFWSYSDTTGSSTWDDFDGRRPDYAVVYEGDGGPISSRRWEAFREGLEDFQLLSTAGSWSPETKARLMEKVKALLKDENAANDHITHIRSFALSEVCAEMLLK